MKSTKLLIFVIFLIFLTINIGAQSNSCTTLYNTPLQGLTGCRDYRDHILGEGDYRRCRDLDTYLQPTCLRDGLCGGVIVSCSTNNQICDDSIGYPECIDAEMLCWEDDLTDDPAVKGNCRLTINGETVETKSDYCYNTLESAERSTNTGTGIAQYFCSPYNTCDRTLSICPAGTVCVNGACIVEEPERDRIREPLASCGYTCRDGDGCICPSSCNNPGNVNYGVWCGGETTTTQPTSSEVTLTSQGLQRNNQPITEATPEAFGGCIERRELATVNNPLHNNPSLIGVCEDTENKFFDTCVCLREGRPFTDCGINGFTHYSKYSCVQGQCQPQTPQLCPDVNCLESCIPKPIALPETIPASCQVTAAGKVASSQEQSGVVTIDVAYYAQSSNIKEITASSSSYKVTPRIEGNSIFLENTLTENESADIIITVTYLDNSYKTLNFRLTGDTSNVNNDLLSKLGL